MENVLESAIGAVIGFALAQLVNVAAIIRKWWRKPVLKIKGIDNSLLVSHSTQISLTEIVDEMYFGFVVQNTGRTLATAVRFQIIGIQFGHGNGKYSDYLGEMALDLSVYNGAHGSKVGAKEITLVPKSAAKIALAWWREDLNTVRPCVGDSFDYYDEMADDVTEFKFQVVAFDDNKNLASATIKIDSMFRKEPPHGGALAGRRPQ